MTDLVKILKYAKKTKALLRKGWCQKTLAQSIKKRAVKVSSPRACSFCILGAIRRACTQTSYEYALRDYVGQVLSERYEWGHERCGWGRTDSNFFVGFNDASSTTKKMVLDVLTSTISLLEERIKNDYLSKDKLCV